MGLPRERKYAGDRVPTIEEIRKLFEYPDRRMKAIVAIMVSSGIRLGAWDFLRYKHVNPIIKDGQIVAATLTVYAGTCEQYNCYITPEAYEHLTDWIDFRRTDGENISEESWLMRNLWDATTPSGGPRGLASVPKKLQHKGIKSLIERAWRAQGIRARLENGKKRYPFATDHGFRKYFKTRCFLAGIPDKHVEMLMNHSLGLDDNYYRPEGINIQDDYIRAVESLTIHKAPDIALVTKEVEESTTKSLTEEFQKQVKGIEQQIEANILAKLSQMEPEKIRRIFEFPTD